MPLQRHPALAPLSREHHHALLLARGVQRDASEHIRATLPRDARELAAHVGGVFDEELAPHFMLEERVLVATLRDRNVTLDAACEKTVEEHRRLRALIEELRAPSTPADRLEALLDAFGALLESHVHDEERVLYTGAQAALDDEELRALGVAIAARDATTETEV